jgi:hypothetical protein
MAQGVTLPAERIPLPCPTQCSLCGHFAATPAEQAHYCQVAFAINGANFAMGFAFVVLILALAFGHLCR